MIVTLNMDTEKDRDTCKKVLELVLGCGCSVDLEVVGQPGPVKSLYWDVETDAMKSVNNEPTRKRRGRPPKNEQPKKRRGRPPKIKKDVYTLAREKTARRNA